MFHAPGSLYLPCPVGTSGRSLDLGLGVYRDSILGIVEGNELRCPVETHATQSYSRCLLSILILALAQEAQLAGGTVFTEILTCGMSPRLRRKSTKQSDFLQRKKKSCSPTGKEWEAKEKPA